MEILMKDIAKPKTSINKSLFLMILSLFAQQTWATEQTNDTSDDPYAHLGELNVHKTNSNIKAGEQVVARQELNKQQINDAKDLVRYNAEVDVAEVGRYGNQGFAIRGVDGNRVAMSVDGVVLPEVEVNEIFAPYGYMYGGRANPDVEMMNSVRINAGSDSLIAGSGAVGGSVSYKSKEPKDLLHGDDNLAGYAKVGYANKNEELLKALGLAGVYNQVEFLLNYAKRHGHETKNHDMRQADNARLVADYVFDVSEMPHKYGDAHSLIYPSPLSFERQSVMAKIYYHPNDNHRIGVHGLHQKQNSLTNTEVAMPTGSRTGSATRRAHDQEKITSYGMNYRYQTNQDSWLDELSLDYTHHGVLGLADTWEYKRDFVCSIAGVSKYLCDDAGGKEIIDKEKVKLSHREYRPTNTNTNQISLKVAMMPLDLGKMGKHNFSLFAHYKKQDYTASATYLSNTTSIKDHINYSFVDSKKTNYSLSLVDDIHFNERLTANLGLRYDDFKYQPYFQNDVNGLSEITHNQEICKNAFNTSLYCQLQRQGKELSNTKFNHLTWGGKVNVGIIANRLNAHYKIGTGFLAPTTSQIYSNFEGMGTRQVPNYNLKPETSLNQELALEFKPTNNISLNVAGYISRYDNFIHTRYWKGDTNGCSSRHTCLQSVNLNKAQIKGIKLGVEMDLSDLLNLDGQLKAFANYHSSKDKAFIKTDNSGTLQINTLAAVPKTLMLGTDYLAPNQNWSLHARLRVIGRKKAKDTKSLQVGEREVVNSSSTCPYLDAYQCYTLGYNSTKSYEYYEYIDTYKHIDRSKMAMIYDIYGSKKFGKNNNLTLNVGVYNITNQKYTPWETLRMFNTVNANNLVDKQGNGFNRYTATGRNYSASLTYEF